MPPQSQRTAEKRMKNKDGGGCGCGLMKNVIRRNMGRPQERRPKSPTYL
jgi:hypothetical protein